MKPIPNLTLVEAELALKMVLLRLVAELQKLLIVFVEVSHKKNHLPPSLCFSKTKKKTHQCHKRH